MMVGLEVERVRQGLTILTTQPRTKDRSYLHRVLRIIDYSMANVPGKVVIISHGYTDYVNRVL